MWKLSFDNSFIHFVMYMCIVCHMYVLHIASAIKTAIVVCDYFHWSLLLCTYKFFWFFLCFLILNFNTNDFENGDNFFYYYFLLVFRFRFCRWFCLLSSLVVVVLSTRKKMSIFFFHICCLQTTCTSPS